MIENTSHDKKSKDSYVVSGAKMTCDRGNAGNSQNFTVPQNRQISIGDNGTKLLGIASDVQVDLEVGSAQNSKDKLTFGECKILNSTCDFDPLPEWFNSSVAGVFVCGEHTTKMVNLVNEYIVKLEIAKRKMSAWVTTKIKMDLNVKIAHIAQGKKDAPCVNEIGIDEHDIEILELLETVINNQKLFSLERGYKEIQKCVEDARKALQAIYDLKQSGEPALTMESVLVCRKGGVISFLDNGQVIYEEVDGIKQEKWPYFFRKVTMDTNGKFPLFTDAPDDPTYVKGWLHFYKPRTDNDIGNLGKKHKGIDVIIKNQKTDGAAIPKGKVAGFATVTMPIYSVCDGIVIRSMNNVEVDNAGSNGGMGNYVVVQTQRPILYKKYTYNDQMEVSKVEQGEAVLTLRYLHMAFEKNNNAEYLLRRAEGQKVVAGQMLGIAGHTGTSTHAHIHFDINIYAADGTSKELCSAAWNGSILKPEFMLDPVNFLTTKPILTSDLNVY